MIILEVISALTVKSVLIGVAFVFVAVWLIRRPRNIPPGPTGWPFIGYLPKLAVNGHEYKAFAELARTYGDIFSLNLGGKLVVVVNSYEKVKKALAHPNISDRPPLTFYRTFTEDPDALGVVSASGESWYEQRKFSLTVLRGLGVGKASFEDAIANEAHRLIDVMKAFKGKPFNPTLSTCNATSNVICSVILGQSFEYSDRKFQKLLKLVNRNFQITGGGSLYQYLPILQFLTFTTNFKEMQQNTHIIMGFLRECVEEHRRDWDPDNPRDFIDVFLGEVRHNESNNKQSHLTPSNLLLTLFELFVAGMETTSCTLRWALLYMIANPEVQAKVQQELDEVVGRNRLPLLADKAELPYTLATILEVQRMASVGALALPHVFSQDTEIFGYDIPQHTMLVANLWAVSRDPSLWPDPEKFCPERFLDKNGKVRHRDEHLPFSTGRRVCLGEQLAKMELFIFFSYLLHQFRFKKPDEAPPISLRIVNGLSLSPAPFEACAIPRE